MADSGPAGGTDPPAEAGKGGSAVPERYVMPPWLDAALQSVSEEARHARDAIAAVAEALSPDQVRHRHGGVPITLLARRLMDEGVRDERVRAGEAMERYEKALLAFRTEMIRHMVDDEGVTVGQAARMLGISRQRAGRMYSSPETDMGQSPK